MDTSHRSPFLQRSNYIFLQNSFYVFDFFTTLNQPLILWQVVIVRVAPAAIGTRK